jgi:hypothetical protein
MFMSGLPLKRPNVTVGETLTRQIRAIFSLNTRVAMRVTLARAARAMRQTAESNQFLFAKRTKKLLFIRR